MREFRFLILILILICVVWGKLRDTCRSRISSWEKDGGRVVGDGERFTGGEGREGSAGDAERAAVVGVSGGEVMASEDGVFDKTTSFFAATNGVFVV